MQECTQNVICRLYKVQKKKSYNLPLGKKVKIPKNKKKVEINTTCKNHSQAIGADNKDIAELKLE
jgi:hypothetical protein